MTRLRFAAACIAMLAGACQQQTETADTDGAVGVDDEQDIAETDISQYDQVSAIEERVILADETLYGQGGEEVGTVEGFVLNDEPMLIASVGAYLGLGGKHVLIPASELSERAAGGYTVFYTAEDLEAMEEFEVESRPETDAAP